MSTSKPTTSGKKKSVQSTAKYTFTENLTRLYLMIMLCVFPLYLSSQKYYYLTLSKTKFFYIATGIYLFILLFSLLADKLSAKHAIKLKTSFALEFVALGTYLLVTIVSTFYTPYPQYVFLGVPERYDGLLTMLFYGAAFFAIAFTYRPGKLELRLFAVSSMILSLIAVLQYYGADIFNLFPYENFPNLTPKTIHFRTTLGNVDIVSSYTSITVLFFSILYINATGKDRFLYLAAGILNMYLMILGGADAGIVGSLGAFVLALPFVLGENRTLVRFFFMGALYLFFIWLFNLLNIPTAEWVSALKSKWLLGFVALAVITAVAFFVGKRKQFNWSAKTLRVIGVCAIVVVILVGIAFVEVSGRDASAGLIYQARELMHGNLRDEFGSYRGFIWTRTATMLKEQTSVGQLLIGSGPDTFGNRFEPFFTEAIKLLDIVYDKAHNEYLQILICQGIFGLISYLVFLVALFVRTVPRMFDRPLLLASAIAALSYAIQALFGLSVPIVTPLFWLILGIVSAQSRHDSANFTL